MSGKAAWGIIFWLSGILLGMGAVNGDAATLFGGVVLSAISAYGLKEFGSD